MGGFIDRVTNAQNITNIDYRFGVGAYERTVVTWSLTASDLLRPCTTLFREEWVLLLLLEKHVRWVAD